MASFTISREAERAVDLLSDRGFPVERIAIVGRDLQLVEQVTGRMGYGQAALRGALQGAVLGLLFGWLFGLFNWIDPVVASFLLALYCLVFGAVVGALLGLLYPRHDRRPPGLRLGQRHVGQPLRRLGG